MNHNGFRNLLLSEREELEMQLRAVNRVCREQAPRFTIKTHPADREDSPEIFSVNVVRVKHIEECLTNVGQALKRLDDRKFGYCEVCGRKIPPKRLNAMPSARLCVDCQTETEKIAHLEPFSL